MSPPALAITEPSLGVTKRARDTDLADESYESWCESHGMDPHSNRSQKAYLMAVCGITGCEAKAMIRAYLLDLRDADAQKASAEEFGPWLRRRGDLMIVRGKAKRAWRVAS